MRRPSTALQHADLVLDHVELAGMFRGAVEFEAAQDAVGLHGRKCLIQRAGGVD